MKKILIIFCIIFCSLAVSAQGIKFEEGTWSQVQAKAKQEGKYIFVDAYTTWCGPCKWMSKNIFPNDTAGQFYNKSFVNYKFDMEKGEGIEFAKAHQVNSYPSYIYFNPASEMVHRSGGSKPLAMFIKDGENALNPEAQFVTLDKKFKSGTKDVKFLKAYGRALMDANQNGDAVIDAYLAAAQPAELQTKESYDLISGLSSPGSKGFEYIVKNKEQYYRVGKKEEVDQFIKYSLLGDASSAGRKKDTAKLEQLRTTLKTFDPAEEHELELNLNYFIGAGDFENAYKNLVPLVDKYKMNDAGDLNNHSWYVFENTSDKAKLQKAAGWAKKSVEMEPEYANTDTYANILFKLGNLDEAQKWAEKSIEFAKKDGIQAAETQKLLDDIKQKNKK